MGKFKSWKYRNIFTSVATSTCLVGASAGLIFGVSAGTFKINYMDLESAEARLASAQSNFNYYSQNIGSEWNMAANLDSHNQEITEQYWKKMHNNSALLDTDPKTGQKYDLGIGNPLLSDDQIRNRYEYMSMVIDGATHSTMDRSFNQGLYNGIVNFIKGKAIESSKLDSETNNDPVKFNCAHSFKPGSDNTTEFLNIYSSVAKSFRTVGLAGFNHVSYLEAMGERSEKDGLFHFNNEDFWKTAFLLIDGDVKNNQNIASVLFRSDEPGWMTGIATCMYFMNNLGAYHDKFQDLSIGAYGGTAIPTVTVYMGGVQRGVEFFNRLILKDKILGKEGYSYLLAKTDARLAELDKFYDMSTFKSMVQYSKHKSEIESFIADYKEGKIVGDEATKKVVSLLTSMYSEYKVHMIKLGAGATHFSGTFASGDAIGITKQYLNRGASAIIAVAGPQSLDTAQEIQNQKSKCIVIGVDSAMEEGDYQRKGSSGASDATVAPDGSTPTQKDNIIKFSAVKDMTSVTSKFAELCGANKNFDVKAQHTWEHITYPEKVDISTSSPEEKGDIEKQVIPDEAFIIETQGEDKVLTGIKDKTVFKQDRSQYTICRIPEGVTKIGTYAFDSMFTSTGEEAFKNVNRIVFNSSAKFEIGKNAFYNCSNITQLDFTNVSKPMYVNASEGENAFKVADDSLKGISEGATKTNSGSIYLNERITDFTFSLKDNFTKELALASGLSTESADWYQINPDVAKSICGIGYKTCGNVENGLISISWDGWHPFFQAMQRLDNTDDPLTGRYSNFMKTWTKAASQYRLEVGEEVLKKEMGDDYQDWVGAMMNIDKLLTYKTDSLLKKYYNHVMGTMGCFMKNQYFTFDRNSTIAKDKHGNFYILPEGKEVKLTILDWLRLNMYFTN